MTLILPDKWKETQAEKRGYVKTQKGVLEGGCQFYASKLRKEQASEVLQQIAKTLWAMRQKMADLSWDDENSGVFIGIQIRNNWVEIDGEWVEKESPEWMSRITKQSLPS